MDTNKDLKKKAFWLTVTTNVIFFLMMMIIVAWKETYPPPEEYGIELGFETSALSEPSDILNESEDSFEEIEESSDDEIIEEQTTEEIIDSDELEGIAEDQINNLDSDEESDLDLVNENESITEEKISESSESEDNKEEEIILKNKIIDERALFNKNTSSSSGSKGSSLEMQGWVWDIEPKPIDNSRESGKIVFEIIVDYYGEIVGLKTIETTLSPSIENIYREEILKLTFSPTNNNNPAELSKGKITFLIKNN
jgi:periplasmic protein TonB